MTAVLEICLQDKRDEPIGSPVTDHIPRKGDRIALRDGTPYVFYRVLDVEHWFDLADRGGIAAAQIAVIVELDENQEV